MTDLSPEVVGRLLELAARVEALEGPDREVDFGIATAIRKPASADKWTGQDQALQAKWYTASLDAAMTLVPADWHAKIEGLNDCWTVSLVPTSSGSVGHGMAFSRSAALALTAASLRARAQAGGGASHG